MNPSYASIRITPDQAAQIARQLYQLSGDIETLPGELDFNFKLRTPGKVTYSRSAGRRCLPVISNFSRSCWIM